MKTRFLIIFLCTFFFLTFMAACAVTDEEKIEKLAAEIVDSNPEMTNVYVQVPTKTPLPTPTPGVGSTRISPIDGMEMIFVPVGEFTMGTNNGKSNEKPAHVVMLDAFWIDKSEITNAMYAMCVADGACETPMKKFSNSHTNYYNNLEYADFPVIYVRWEDAKAYCEWAGRTLPSEAQWEKAARGTDGRHYPWGNTEPSENIVNFDKIINDTSKVCAYPEGNSPYGVCDMAGNAEEWVTDWYDKGYYSKSPKINPTGPESGTYRVIRGGGWQLDKDRILAFNRGGLTPNKTGANIGFRCVLLHK